MLDDPIAVALQALLLDPSSSEQQSMQLRITRLRQFRRAWEAHCRIDLVGTGNRLGNIITHFALQNSSIKKGLRNPSLQTARIVFSSAQNSSMSDVYADGAPQAVNMSIRHRL